MAKPNNKNIIIVVEGGVIQDVIKPKKYTGVPIEIRDFDVSDDTSPRLCVDDNGNSYEKSVY